MGRDNWRVMKCGSTYLSMSVTKQVVDYLYISSNLVHMPI